MTDTIFENKEVTWKVLDIPVSGTMTYPKDSRTHSAVVFVAGSGPTDRNWCSPALPGTNGSAKLLAEKLVAQGYVTLRYDKIASGPRAKENVPKFSGKISMQTHTEELTGGVETLLSEKNVNKDSILALTNSEGAIHAVNYQLQAKSNRFKGLVLTGAPGRANGEVSQVQISEQVNKSLPNAEAIMKHYDDAVSDFLAGKPMVFDQLLPEGIKLVLHALENPANLPFSRELWMYNLPDHITKVEEPVLILIGKKDVQIDWRTDGGELEKATKGKNSVSFAYPENANHVLKHENKQREELTAEYVGSHYNAPDSVLDEEATNIILDWLNDNS